MLKRFNWPNNKIRYFGLFLGTLIVLGSFFVGVNYVLALDDNTQVPACGPANCDANQPVCSSFLKTFIYNTNAWQSNGNPSCCGDDSQESYIPTVLYSGQAGQMSTLNIPTCCSSGYMCQSYGGTCYSPPSWGDMGEGNPDQEYCINSSGPEWVEQDSGDWVCQYEWLPNSQCQNAGPGGVCSDYGGLTSFCCGDDQGENMRYCFADGSALGSYTCAGGNICCRDDNTCAYNNTCYTFPDLYASAYSIGLQSDKKTVCGWGTWFDCDQDEGEFLTVLGGGAEFQVSQPEVCEDICGYNWSIGGESAAFGEYNSGTATECCGDDANEYYTQLCPGVSGVPRKCCNSSGDKINAAGNCVPLCSLPDLTITDVWTSPVSGNILPGNSVTLYATVKNNGAASAGSSTTLLGMGSSFPGGSTCGATTAALNADSQVGGSCAVTAPVCGSYTVGAEADTAHIITESDESNNVRTETGYQVNCGAPGVFNLTSPTNNAGCQPTGPTLQWSASTDPGGGAITYNLYYCQGASCSLPGTPNISGISGTTWSLSGLIVGATYRWNIIASDGFLQTSSGNGPFAFTINNPPNTPSNPTPANSSTCIAFQPTLAWSGGDPDVCDTTINYKIYWCTGAGCNPTTVQATVANVTSYTPSASFFANTIVRWKVEASDTKVSATGPVWQFTTSTGLPTASVTDAVNSTCSTTDTVAVSWSNGATGNWGYSADSTCNSSDSFPNSGNSALVNATHADYLCFRVANTCSLYGYSPAQGPLKVDISAPTIGSVAASCQGSLVRVTVNGAADAGCAGLASSAYSFDAGSTWQVSNVKDFSGYSLNLSAGQIKVRDALGNTYTYGNPVTISCDTTPPTITSVTASSPACATIRFTVNGAADAGSGLASSPYSFDAGSNWQTNNYKDYTPYTSYTLAAGNVKVRDAAGNIYTHNSPVSGTAASCNTAPNTPTGLAQQPGNEESWTNDNTPYFNFHISDPDTGDTVGYTILIDGNSGFGTPEVTGTWAGTSGVNSTDVSYQVTSALSDGSYYWRVRARDAAGLTSAWADDNNGFAGSGLDFNIDTVAPPAPTCNPGSSNFSSTIDVTCSDTESGVTIRWTTNGTEPNTGSALYSSTLTFNQTTTLKVRAWDGVGNASGTNTYDYTKGNLPNTSIDSNPPNPSNDSTPTFTFSGTGSPTSFNCRYDGTGGWSSCTSPRTYTITQGSRTFEVRTNNSYGTDPTPASYSWLVDLTNPTVTNLTASSPICSGAGTSVSWTGADTGGSGINRQELWRRINSASWEGWCNDGSWRADCSSYGGIKNLISPQTVTLTTTGTTEFGIHIYDNAGNYLYSSAVTVTVNAAPGAPGNPTYGTPTQTSIPVNWTAASGAASYNLYRCTGAGCMRPATATHTNVTSTYTDNNLACNTSYNYWIEAVNSCGSTFSSAGGNITTSACQEVQIDFNPESRGWSYNDASVIVTATTATGGVSFVHYCWANDAACDPGIANSNDSPFTCSGTSPCAATVAQTDTGSWTLCVRARSTAGIWNSSPVCSSAYRIDKIPPTVNSFTVEDTAPGGSVTITIAGQKPTAKWDVTENESGFNIIELWRANYNSSNCNGATMSGCSWSTLWTDNQEDNASGRDDTTALDVADYWYGAHIKDNVDNCALENNTACGSAGNPITLNLAKSLISSSLIS